VAAKAHANVVPTRRKHHLQAEIRAHVAAKSAIYTDALMSYQGLNPDFAHKTIDHAERYVEGQVHTNGLENFWSLLKRGLKGTYIAVKPFHLFRYETNRYSATTTAPPRTPSSEMATTFKWPCLISQTADSLTSNLLAKAQMAVHQA
jgi:hypothetical protein